MTFTDNDKLGRKDSIKTLIEFMNTFKDQPLTIGLNGDWGTGKTFFLEMMKEELKGKYIIKIDIFEMDYLDDPLLPIIGELLKKLKDSSLVHSKGKELIKSISKGSLKIGGALIGLALKVSTGIDASKVMELAGEFAENQLEEYKGKSKSINEFKSALEAEASEQEPIIFMIDELDRCQPIFALKVMEIIKHIFDVKNVYFILSFNKDMMKKAIQKVYGNVDAENYLHKFVPYEFTLPMYENEYREFLDFKLIKELGDEKAHHQFSIDSRKILIPLFIYYNTSLRSIERIVRYFRIYYDILNQGSIKGVLYSFFIYLKVEEPEQFKMFVENKFDSSKLQEKIDLVGLSKANLENAYSQSITKLKEYLSYFHKDNISSATQPVKEKMKLDVLASVDLCNKLCHFDSITF